MPASARQSSTRATARPRRSSKSEGGRLLLASASPRRRELLERAGIPCDVAPVDIAERRAPGEPPLDYVRRLAREKAEAARRRRPDRVVLGADTIVVTDGDVLEKPVDDADAARMLERLSGRAHDVFTGIAIASASHAQTIEEVIATRVWFVPLSEADVRWYVATGEPAGKAGAYAIQGLASRFVSRIEGCYANVVGLPVAAVLQSLRAAGLQVEGLAG
jgi:septum formation protein